MKKFYKLAVLFLTAALALGFVSCKTDVETEYVIKEVEVLKEVPTDMTSHEATAVYHYKQNLSGVGYTNVTYEENEDGTVKEDDSGNSVAIETAQTVAAGTKLSSIAKTFYGFNHGVAAFGGPFERAHSAPVEAEVDELSAQL